VIFDVAVDVPEARGEIDPKSMRVELTVHLGEIEALLETLVLVELAKLGAENRMQDKARHAESFNFIKYSYYCCYCVIIIGIKYKK